MLSGRTNRKRRLLKALARCRKHPPDSWSSEFCLEAPSGFEPLHRSFADCSLTTWVRRLAKGAL